jgi:hypothetical protein
MTTARGSATCSLLPLGKPGGVASPVGPIEPFRYDVADGEQVYHAGAHLPDRVVEMDVAVVDVPGAELRVRDALASPTFRALGESDLVEVFALEDWVREPPPAA